MKVAGKEQGDDSTTKQIVSSINCGWMPSSYGPNPGNNTYNNWLINYAMGISLKLDYTMIITILYDLLCNDASMNCRMESLWVIIIVPPMQSTGGNNHLTYIVFVPPQGSYACFAMPPISKSMAIESWGAMNSL